MTDLLTRRRKQEPLTSEMEEIDLLLREIEALLLREVEEVRGLQRDRNRGRDPERIFEIPLRLLRLKKNRSILESAILAYAEKHLQRLAEKRPVQTEVTR